MVTEVWKKAEVLTREDLDLAECRNPACEAEDGHPIPITPACHPGAPTVLLYAKDEGVLIVICPVCRQLVTRIAVGAREVH